MNKFLEVLDHLAPALASFGGIYTPLIIAGIKIAELTCKQGKDKKAIAKEVVRGLAEVSNLKAGHTVVNSDKAVQAAEETIDSFVGLTNDTMSLLPIESVPTKFDPDSLNK